MERSSASFRTASADTASAAARIAASRLAGARRVPGTQAGAEATAAACAVRRRSTPPRCAPLHATIETGVMPALARRATRSVLARRRARQKAPRRSRSCSPARVRTQRITHGTRSLREASSAWRQASAPRRRMYERARPFAHQHGQGAQQPMGTQPAQALGDLAAQAGQQLEQGQPRPGREAPRRRGPARPCHPADHGRLPPVHPGDVARAPRPSVIPPPQSIA